MARELDQMAEEIRVVFARKDLAAFGDLLADDARWGDDDNPKKCRSRADVIATFRRLLGEGVDGEVVESVTGPKGIAVRLDVRWPNPGEGREATIHHAYLVNDGLITEIQPHEDRRSAIAAIRR